ncbi:hypothetical protein JQN58_24130 [Aneurinibacillus sp. BA2021]|nr:hypothetical protein [Aneurinibacillus sp. BA2021]
MHAFYRETRRVAASVLAGAQLYFVVWNAANHHGVAAVLTTGAPLIAAALLLAAVFVRKRGPLDVLAFWCPHLPPRCAGAPRRSRPTS